MIPMRKIRELGRQIGREFDPERVLVFGSHARGEAGPDSDVDLLIVMACEGSPLRRATEFRLQLNHALPLDVRVRTPEEVRRRLRSGDPFIRGVLSEGVVLYEGHRR